MSRCLIIILSAVLFFCPLELQAAEPAGSGEIAGLFGSFSPEPGGWSEYAIFDKSTGGKTTIRMAVVAEEGGAYWYEAVNMKGEGSHIIKMLVKGDPNNTENILRIVTQSGAAAAQEISRDFVNMERRKVKHLFERWSGLPSTGMVGLEKIQTGTGTAVVPAGTFEATKYQIVDTAGKVYAEFMLAGEIYPFGVIASETEDSTMILMGHGFGADSLVTGKPAMMEPPPGLMEQILRGMSSGAGPPYYPPPGPGDSLRQIQGMGTGYESMK